MLDEKVLITPQERNVKDEENDLLQIHKDSFMRYPLYKWYQMGLLSKPLDVSDEDYIKVERSYNYLMDNEFINDKNTIYGLHTSYGENERNRIDPDEWKNTQINLLDYLRVGIGEPLPEPVVRRALKLQVIKTGYGVSAVHPMTYKALLELANSKVIPTVPRKGSLGASGDLISMAHAITPLFKNNDPKGPRDVIGLVNTNSIMASWAIQLDHRLRQLMTSCFEAVALTSIAIGAGEEHFTIGLNHNSVHPSYGNAGGLLIDLRNKYLESERIVEGEKSLHQARYSVRCSPQVLGHCMDLLDFSETKISSEVIAIADNPLILETGPWHGGLFYAIGLASASESMMEITHKLSEMLDRQVLILMDSRLNGGLEDNLHIDGYNHCKGIHQLLSALFQEIKARSTPVRQMSFSCEGNNQDLVPCGMTALNNLNDQLDTFEDIVRGTMFCALRGAMSRSSLALPKALKLENWDKFNLNTVMI
ncbi:aromatic amino acid lyase [Aquimarina sp. AU58]|uniref:aromatic amino acid lyase n=1 Tax=Aquimarina sp. AU58 TaxID=1874112 RepID=UPI000D65B5BE|nr:aromatic amino acid lyase [Aquimarina sp. AU58]